MGQPWIGAVRPAAGPPRGRVVVVPHAGGGPNSLLPLLEHLPGDLEVAGVTLPGRERRFGEPLTGGDDPDVVVGAVLDELATLPPLPTTLFGHSMGAAVAGAAAQLAPEAFDRVVLSSYPDAGTADEREGRFSDARLLDVLTRGAGTPDEVLQNPFWRAHLLDVLRSDLTLGARLAHAGFPRPLRVPLVVLHGDRDGLAAPAGPRVWQDRAGAGSEYLALPGGHFHLLDPPNRPVVAGLLRPAA